MSLPFRDVMLIGASLLVGLALAEGLTRLVRPHSTVEYRVDPEVGQILASNQQARWVSLDYDVEVTTNRAGFHDHEHAIEKPSDVYRIVVLGDSFIEGLAVPIESGFTQQLASQLQARTPRKRIDVVNLGVSGIGPAQYLRLLERRGLGYQPDLVLMAIYPQNDYWDSYEGLSGAPSKAFYNVRSDGSLQYVPPEASRIGVAVRPYLRRSAFLNLVRQGIALTSLERQLGTLGILQAPGVAHDRSRYWGVYDAALPSPWPDAYRTTLQVIDAAKELSRQQGVEFAALTIGSVTTVENRWDELYSIVPEARSMTVDAERPFTAIADLGRQEGFAVIDLARPFREDFLSTGISRSWPHDGHWNSSGHRLAAELVASHILDHRREYHLID